MSLLWALSTLDLNMLLLKWLAVAGGGALGAVGTGLIVRLIGKFVTSRNVPGPMVMLVRLLGGAAVALAVYIWAFGSGGSGWWPGGGGEGAGGGQAGRQEGETGPTVKEPAATTPSLGEQDQEKILRVVVLGGGQVHDQRVYRVAGEEQARTFAELKKAVLERQQRRHLTTINLVFYENSNTRANLPLGDMEEWARENHLTVTYSSPPGDVP